MASDFFSKMVCSNILLWLALRPCWLVLRSLKLAIRPVSQACKLLQLSLRPLQPAHRLLQSALRRNWRGLRASQRGGQLDGWTELNLSPLNRTLSPVRTAALLPPGTSQYRSSRAREPMSIWCLWATVNGYVCHVAETNPKIDHVINLTFDNVNHHKNEYEWIKHSRPLPLISFGKAIREPVAQRQEIVLGALALPSSLFMVAFQVSRASALKGDKVL